MVLIFSGQSKQYIQLLLKFHHCCNFSFTLDSDGDVLKYVYNNDGQHKETKFYYGKTSESTSTMGISGIWLKLVQITCFAFMFSNFLSFFFFFGISFSQLYFITLSAAGIDYNYNVWLIPRGSFYFPDQQLTLQAKKQITVISRTIREWKLENSSTDTSTEEYNSALFLSLLYPVAESMRLVIGKLVKDFDEADLVPTKEEKKVEERQKSELAKGKWYYNWSLCCWCWWY